MLEQVEEIPIPPNGVIPNLNLGPLPSVPNFSMTLPTSPAPVPYMGRDTCLLCHRERPDLPGHSKGESRTGQYHECDCGGYILAHVIDNVSDGTQKHFAFSLTLKRLCPMQQLNVVAVVFMTLIRFGRAASSKQSHVALSYKETPFPTCSMTDKRPCYFTRKCPQAPAIRPHKKSEDMGIVVHKTELRESCVIYKTNGELDCFFFLQTLKETRTSPHL